VISTASPSRPAEQVWACIVCFHADRAALRSLIAALAPQVARLVVVDNGPGEAQLDAPETANCLYVPMDRNAGTAGALNEAWRLALASGAAYLVGFDQDSRPGPAIIRELHAAFHAGNDLGRPLAAVGPAWVDARSGRPMRLLRPVRFWRRHASPAAQGLVEVDHLITSGAMVSAAAFRAVGPFDERLFLDYVDVEWSLRARARGFALASLQGCEMAHAIGDDVRTIARWHLAVHKPQRNYLQARNHLLLWRNAELPRLWLLSDLIQVACKMAALVALAPNRLERLRWITRGFADGLRGRSGPSPR
jgi:rhamnosyltransferase